jgi:citrate lyase subunit beta/citryl-CoA lyase
MALHPRDALFDPEDRPEPALPVCDHYAGVEPRMSKSLQLQAELGPVFDVTLDNEDGAPVGREVEHARLIAGLLGGPLNRFGRVGVRLLPVSHPAFAEVANVVLGAAKPPVYLMIPKPRGPACIDAAARTVDRLGGADVPLRGVPLRR